MLGHHSRERIPKQDILPVSLMKYKAIYSLYLEPVTDWNWSEEID